ncbi:MAG: hypothetical protein LBE62_05430 [Azonexus sp.]|nr:hypothetical protein [Azonexus sp.]
MFDDSGKSARFGFFGIGAAIRANYGYFTHQGLLYRSVGGGSVLIQPVTDSPAKYIVRETALVVVDGSVLWSKLQVLEKASGKELARRNLIEGTIEDGNGWKHEHAIKFVGNVLHSPQAPRRPRGVYPTPPATVEFVKATDASPYPMERDTRLPKNCGEAVWLEPKPDGAPMPIVRLAGFTFRPADPLKFVACDSGRLLVGSGVYASNLNLDLLTLDGRHLAQGYVRLPLPLEAWWLDIQDVDLANESITMTILANYRPDLRSSSQQAYGRVTVSVKLPP